MYLFPFVILALLSLTISVMAQFNDVQKPGDCPPPTQVNICEYRCFSDNECAGIGKCCRTMCGGSICTRPVTMRQGANLVKPGMCPVKPTGPWVCTSTCASDGDCRGKAKCCKNRCGAYACTRI